MNRTESGEFVQGSPADDALPDGSTPYGVR